MLAFGKTLETFVLTPKKRLTDIAGPSTKSYEQVNASLEPTFPYQLVLVVVRTVTSAKIKYSTSTSTE